MTAVPKPSLPRISAPSIPRVQLPRRGAVVRTAKAALPWIVVAGQVALLAAPFIAPYLAPAAAAQLLLATHWLALVLALVA